jgi:catechol 2,3-dioxygenase-like lactoylglutathione lyase family enzyme
MIDHTGIGVAHVGRSAAFYDAALGALGIRRVIELPKNDGTDGVGYGVSSIRFFGSTAFIPTAQSSTRPSLRGTALKSTPFTRRPSKRVEPITVLRGFAIPAQVTRKVTTRRSCSILTAIT